MANEAITTKWFNALNKATDFDSWGQLVEAQDEYLKLSKHIKTNLPYLTTWEDDKKTLAAKVASCLEIRSKFLKSSGTLEEMRLEEVKKLIPVLESLGGSAIQELPHEVNLQVERIRRLDVTESAETTENIEDTEEDGLKGKLSMILPKLKVLPGMTVVTVQITKIGLKDAADYIDPVITITCRDLRGVDLCPKQTTSTPATRDDTYLHFGVDVDLQMPLEQMTKGTGIFFELYHYKPKRKTTSMRCYAFMEIDELKPGPCVIELYNKPIDVKRKKLTLFTKKPLYLHLNLTLTKQH